MRIQIGAIQNRFFYLLCIIVFSFAPAKSWTQDDVFKSIQQRFGKFSEGSVHEKVYLHTDKKFYLAGEIIWFKIYYVDGVSYPALNLSKVAYVEIVDRNQKPVLQAKISLTGKGGSGTFYLPLTLNSGNYTVRAYTNWMKNAGSVSFFEKFISIVNTMKPAEGKLPQDSSRVTASFFPEGGNMVQGIETKVAFHIADQNGKGVECRGIITDDMGDTIKNFFPYRFGIGNFIFKPLAGRNYKATILLPDGRYFTSSLPLVYDYGYVMNVTDNKDGRIKVRIQARNKDNTTDQRGENVFLLAHTRQKLKAAEYGFINYENDLVLYIDKASLAEGVSHFTLFNTKRQPVCERLIFTRPKNKISTSIISDKNIYEKRQKVNLTISSAAESQLSVNSDYSVSVFQTDSLQVNEQDDITSWFWLSSDLGGHVESPWFYFSDEANTDEAADNLLLSHGWRRFRWENVLSSAMPGIQKFIPEYRGHLITAKITNANDGKIAANVDCFLSFSGSPFGFYVAKTDSNGIVYFDAKDYYGPGEIIIQAGHEIVNNYRVDVLTPFTDERVFRLPPLFTIGKNNEKWLTEKSIAMQAQNIYVADSLRKFNPPLLADTFPFFGKAEYTYRLDDYKRFTTMEEVLREYVLPINVVLRNGKLYMSIYDDVLRTIYTDNVLVLLDGVPLKDYQKIFSYDPLKVKKLEVVPIRYTIGGINYNGIASFETYQGKFDGFELAPGIIAVDYEGLQLQREFYSPVYENRSDREKRIPDTRTTLYWAPDVLTDKTGMGSLQFYTSDQQGKFLVLLQGFNARGEPISAASSFIVE